MAGRSVQHFTVRLAFGPGVDGKMLPAGSVRGFIVFSCCSTLAYWALASAESLLWSPNSKRKLRYTSPELSRLGELVRAYFSRFSHLSSCVSTLHLRHVPKNRSVAPAASRPRTLFSAIEISPLMKRRHLAYLQTDTGIL